MKIKRAIDMWWILILNSIENFISAIHFLVLSFCFWRWNLKTRQVRFIGWLQKLSWKVFNKSIGGVFHEK